MTRTDAHLDAMLRRLGAAYYESLHGRAARPVSLATLTMTTRCADTGGPGGSAT